MARILNKDRAERPCIKCGTVYRMEQFDWVNKGKQIRCAQCRSCRREQLHAWRDANRERMQKWYREYAKTSRAANPEPYRQHELRRRCKKYGVTVEWYKAQLSKQQSVCALCLKPEISKSRREGVVRSLAIDHCHVDGTARGLLCSACNQAVGKIEASPGWLERAAVYLKETETWRSH